MVDYNITDKVELGYRTNVPSAAPFPGTTGYPSFDSISAAPGHSMQTGGQGVLVSLGTVGGMQAYVTVPKSIFDYYPEWMVQHGKEMDNKRWQEFSRTQKVDLDKTESFPKVFFTLWKLIAAFAAGPEAFLHLTHIGGGYFVTAKKEGGYITAEVGKDPALPIHSPKGKYPVKNPRQEAFEKKFADYLVEAVLLPVTIGKVLLGGLSRGLDAVGKGLEVVWNVSQPVLAPIGRALAGAYRWIRQTLQPITTFLQEHTRPGRAHEDLTTVFKAMGRVVNRLSETSGLKRLARVFGDWSAKAGGQIMNMLLSIVERLDAWLYRLFK